ncbi:MAG TPA: hypothetical protein ENH94_02055 [Phycisphaerales bacterium]|nr:hypothetical protein [Phycisphaerales bacterium]
MGEESEAKMNPCNKCLMSAAGCILVIVILIALLVGAVKLAWWFLCWLTCSRIVGLLVIWMLAAWAWICYDTRHM